MDPSQTPSPTAGSDESPTQLQARLRRERREAKIKAGGSSRLDKITQVSGRPAEAAPSPFPDPPDNDPSTLPSHYPSNSTPQTEADIRALLRAGAPPPGVDTVPDQQQDEDPMTRILQQLMGGLSGPDGQAPDGLPPALAAMLGGSPPQATKATAATATSASLWRLLQAVSALALGIYLAAHTSFVAAPRLLTEARSTAVPPASAIGGKGGVVPVSGGDMFWMFAGAELVLQGSRMVLERGEGREMGGWVGMVGGMLPEPWRGWVRLGMRYRGIWGTVVEDGMVVVWVLGCVGWWRGMGG